MAYVDAFFDRTADVIKVVERSKKGERVFKDIPIKYTFYYKDPKGKFLSIFGDPLNRIVCKSTNDYRKEMAINAGKTLFESDMNPVYSALSEHYLNHEAPKLNVAFWDIEVDIGPDGYSTPEDALTPITAISVYLQWLDTLICLAVPPKTLTMEQAIEEVKDFPNTMLYKTEAEMLNVFLDIIQDADLLSGWNCQGYDVPFCVNRVTKVLSKDDTRRFCLFNQLPKKREYERYGKISSTYDFVGRVNIDSLELYKKYTYEERHSYTLNSIAEHELGEHKTEYDGTLDQLYNNDFKTFIEYNRQDTMLLQRLDEKLKFIELSNLLAHENTVLLSTTLGAVALTEQAIINEAHSRGVQVQNRPKVKESSAAAGAYVAYPKKGMHDWIGSLDINSLYPSVIRALNMGPETIIGQLRQTATDDYIAKQMARTATGRVGKTAAAAWEGIFGSFEYTSVMNQELGTDITIDWFNGDSDVVSAAEAYKLVFKSNQPWMLSANGTIFTYEKEGIIPGLLKRWYEERQEMQAKLRACIEAGNKIEEEYWDKRQLVKKIVLNSLYGAILNASCRFFDKRIGQSTTLTGRQIVKHMTAGVNEIITGDHDYLGKSVIYNDTDSEISSTVHQTNYGEKTIEDLFVNSLEFWEHGDKEYAHDPDLMVMSYDPDIGEPFLSHTNYIYRHKVSKDLYEIEDELGNTITVTEDHSVMVERNNELIEVKPQDILDNDMLISIMLNNV